MSRNPRIDNRRSLHIISEILHYVFLKISLSFLKILTEISICQKKEIGLIILRA